MNLWSDLSKLEAYFQNALTIVIENVYGGQSTHPWTFQAITLTRRMVAHNRFHETF